MRIIALLTAVALLATLAAPAYAGDTFEWTGADGGNTNWDDADNWSGAAGYPGDGVGGVKDDIAKIAGNLADNKYPVVCNESDITIKRLEIVGKVGEDDLVFLSDDASHKLRIDTDGIAEGKVALKLTSAHAIMKLQKKSELWFTSDDQVGDKVFDFVIDSNGTIEFAGSGQDADMPKLVVADGKTVTAVGQGRLVGTWQGRITGEVVGSPDAADVFVLGRNATIWGSFTIDATFYHHGDVHTSPDYLDLDPDVPGKITLTCNPKGGTGNWWVDGGTGSANLSEVIVDANLAGDGNVEVSNFGVLRVNRHMSVGTIDRGVNSGNLFLNRGAKVRVAKGILFEIDRFLFPDCPGTR